MSDKFERTYDADEIWAEIEHAMERAPLLAGEAGFPHLATRITAEVIGARWLADVAAAGLQRGDGELEMEMWIADDHGLDGTRQVRVRGPVRPAADVETGGEDA